MTQFKVISDEARRLTRPGGTKSPFLLVLLDGKTVRVEASFKPGGWYTNLARLGMRFHCHKEGDGFVLWAEPKP